LALQLAAVALVVFLHLRHFRAPRGTAMRTA
jgi:hypothetical protein